MTTTQKEATQIAVAERDTTLNPRQLRFAGKIPATVYGKGRDPQSIQMDTHTFVMHLSKGQRNFSLEGLGATPVAVKAHQVQINPISQQVLNVEFLAQ
ncbi:MAG: hypothetical protein QE263_03330 [Vampirovibrionales bacterium]|nr:hypothetical protein [Vampirovibrionales bacterium]